MHENIHMHCVSSCINMLKFWVQMLRKKMFDTTVFRYYFSLFFMFVFWFSCKTSITDSKRSNSCLKKISILSIKQKKLTSVLIAAWSKTKDFFYMSSVLLVHTMSSVVCYRRWKQITNKYFNRKKKCWTWWEKNYTSFSVFVICVVFGRT